MLIQLAVAAPVLPHAFPIRSEPRVGSTAAAAPPKVTIWFDSELEPAFSTIYVYDAQRRRVDKNNSQVDPATPTVLAVDLSPLSPGKYRVEWSVVARDTHRIEGSFSFSVAAP